MVVLVPLERFEILSAPLGVPENAANPAPAVQGLGVERVDFQGQVQTLECFLRVSAAATSISARPLSAAAIRGLIASARSSRSVAVSRSPSSRSLRPAPASATASSGFR